MTTENELDVIENLATNETKEEVKNDIPSNNEDVPLQSPPAPIESANIEDEKPKRAGRKKRELSDVKIENSHVDNAMDTQPLFEQPVIVEGKRSRKPTSRLELSDLATPKKELSIPQGHGKPLGEIEYINYQITQASTDVLSRMRNICFGRRASNTDIRKNLRDFNGFEFERDSEEYQRHLSNLTKLKKEQLQSISDILGLTTSTPNEENAARILTFLMAPIDEGKPVPVPERKMSMRTTTKASTNSKESIPTDEDEKTENGGEDDDELFFVDDEEDEEEEATDDDYIGSDDESGSNIKDDPDDFVYQPGKKTPKKRGGSLKRSRSRTTPKRKRGSSTRTSRRGRKKPRVTVTKPAVENDDLATVPTEPMQTNNQLLETTETNPVDLNNLSEQTATSSSTTDIIPATS